MIRAMYMTIKLSQGSDYYLNYKFMKILAEYSFCG